MGKIQELSESLANQIAAGEVVERPASVVKELIENALDAGSSQIDIYLEEAGLRKIQIIDNGEGMVTEDARNAFKRHATSKIHHRNDLFRIRTLGFRGEALPSIASVSQITLETAHQTQNQGTFLVLKGGQILEEKPSALRQGTKITVENLFFNTPARLKYVKSLQTELANIGDIVNRLALSHPEVAFRLVHDGNKMLTTTGNGDLKQSIMGIYGLNTAKKMREIKAEDLDFKIHGYISLPEITRASRNYLSIIINGRYIKNFVLNKAIVTGYGSKLMIGRFPIGVVKIEMDPLLVDVNVHPTKQEVRLSKEVELANLISQAIQERLKEENLIPNVVSDDLFKKKKVALEQVEQTTLDFVKPNSSVGALNFNPSTGQFFVEEAATPVVENIVDNLVEKPTEAVKLPEVPQLEAETTTFEAESHLFHQTTTNLDFVDNSVEPLLPPEEQVGTQKETVNFPHLEYFGQMHGTYLFAQSHEGLYIVDQHAAQERIKYEYYRQKIAEVGKDLQSLLVPVVLEYSQVDWLKIKEHLSILQAVNIFLEDFGNNSFIIREHPSWFPMGEEEMIIREIVEIVLETGTFDLAKFREATAIMMSCKRSIKANHYLNERQARVLLEDLAKCENPFNCPHGRPVLIHFSNREMERLFKRIQDHHQSKGAME